MTKIISTKDGFKKYDGYSWVYYNKVNCIECGIDLFRSKQYIKRNPTFVCDKCKNIHILKTRDVKAYNILSNKTPNFYYLLGLIASDGYITWPKCTPKARGYTCEITLKNDDKELLYNIHKRFGGNIYEYKRYTKWLVCSKPFIEYLKTIGFTNNKSLTIDIEPWINDITKEEQIYFLRGIFDGDGSIYKTKKGLWGMEIACFSPTMLNTLYGICSSYNMHKEPHRIVLWGRFIIPFIKTLYNDKSCFYMKRKYEKAQQLIKETYDNTHTV